MEKELLGVGFNRKVYALNEDLIIKIPIDDTEKSKKSNLIEYEVWNKIKNTEYGKYFCPCINLKNGVLTAKRATAILNTSKYKNIDPKLHYSKFLSSNFKKIDEIELFIDQYNKKNNKNIKSDFVADNIGIYNNRFVIVDYGQKIILDYFKNGEP